MTREEVLSIYGAGGLGNQMFAYAAGCFFAAQMKCGVEVIRPPKQQQNFRGYDRPFRLDRFHITAPVRDAGPCDRVFFSSRAAPRIMQGLIGPLRRVQRVEERTEYCFDPPEIRAGCRRTYLKGYWQAAAYVEASGEQLRREFVLRTPLQEAAARWAERIEQMNCPVAVHVRIGDYALIHHGTEQGGKVSQILPAHYYVQALRAARGELPGAAFVVFSDEPEKARELLRGADGCHFVEGGHDDCEDLFLMSQCRHQVIANSSFSWWAAWLNRHPQKKVFAPRYWGNTAASYFPDLCPKDWRLIDNL